MVCVRIRNDNSGIYFINECVIHKHKCNPKLSKISNNGDTEYMVPFVV